MMQSRETFWLEGAKSLKKIYAPFTYYHEITEKKPIHTPIPYGEDLTQYCELFLTVETCVNFKWLMASWIGVENYI